MGGLSYEVWTPGALLSSFGSLALSHANRCFVHFASLTCRSGGQRVMWLIDRHQLKGGSSISPRCVWLKNIVTKLKRGLFSFLTAETVHKSLTGLRKLRSDACIGAFIPSYRQCSRAFDGVESALRTGKAYKSPCSMSPLACPF